MFFLKCWIFPYQIQYNQSFISKFMEVERICKIHCNFHSFFKTGIKTRDCFKSFSNFLLPSGQETEGLPEEASRVWEYERKQSWRYLTFTGATHPKPETWNSEIVFGCCFTHCIYFFLETWKHVSKDFKPLCQKRGNIFELNN